MRMIAEKKAGSELAGNQDTSFLKMLAVCLMMTDHLGVVIFGNVPELRVIGRMAFPLYTWCLVVGSVKTRNIYRYGLRLLLLGVASQPLYMMALSHPWRDLNILFTLLIGLAAIGGIQIRKYGSQFWMPVLCFVLLHYLKVDYGWRGVMFMLVLYGARKTKSGLIAAYLAYTLFWGASSATIVELFGQKLAFLQWPGIGTVLSSFFRMQGMVWLSLPLVVCSFHTGLRVPKWLGYALYPMHLVLLIFIRLWAGGATWEMLLAGF